MSLVPWTGLVGPWVRRLLVVSNPPPPPSLYLTRPTLALAPTPALAPMTQAGSTMPPPDGVGDGGAWAGTAGRGAGHAAFSVALPAEAMRLATAVSTSSHHPSGSQTARPSHAASALAVLPPEVRTRCQLAGNGVTGRGKTSPPPPLSSCCCCCTHPHPSVVLSPGRRPHGWWICACNGDA